MSIPPPAVTPVVAPAIRPSLSARVFDRVTTAVGSGMFRPGGEQVVKFPLKPLLPAILASGMIIYERGNERRMGHDPNQKTVQLLTELGAGVVLVLKTSGFYSVIAFLKTLFDMGLQHDKLDKYKSVVQNLGVFTTGFLGIWSGIFIAEGLNRSADRALLKSLNDSSVNQWIVRHAGQATTEGQLASSLQNVKQLTEQMIRHSYQNRSLSRKARNGVIGELHHAWNFMNDPNILPTFTKGTASKPFRQLYGVTEHIQDWYVRTARIISPAVWGLLVTTFVGVPIIRRVNRMLEKRHPEWRGEQVEYFRLPELANRKGNYHGPGNAHSIERGEGGASHGGAEAGGHGGEGPEFPSLTIPEIGTIV